ARQTPVIAARETTIARFGAARKRRALTPGSVSLWPVGSCQLRPHLDGVSRDTPEDHPWSSSPHIPVRRRSRETPSRYGRSSTGIGGQSETDPYVPLSPLVGGGRRECRASPRGSRWA